MLSSQWLTPLAIAAAAAAIFLWARRQANTPPEDGTVRYMPYTGIMFLALIVILLCGTYGIAHLSVP